MAFSDDLDRRLGAGIKAQRLLRNYSRARLAERLAMSERSLSRIEAGEIRLTVACVCRIAGQLDVPLTAIFDTGGGGRPSRSLARVAGAWPALATQHRTTLAQLAETLAGQATEIREQRSDAR